MVTGNHPYFTAAIEELSARATAVTHSEEIGEAVRKELEHLKDSWLNQAENMTGGATLGYKPKRDGQTVGLLRPPGNDWTPFTCLNSLRDVEPSINLILDDRGLGDHVEKMSEDEGEGTAS